MAIPTLTPASEVSAIVLPATGSTSFVASKCPIGVYTASVDFLSGASDQVAYTYQKLGGDILDIELTTGSVYAAYEEAVLEYSYILNMHQSKNILSDVLGMTTGTFNHDGELKDGILSSSLSGTHISLKYPKITLAFNQRYTEGISTQAGIGGSTRIYSGSFTAVDNKQDYDLGAIILSASNNDLDEATGNPVPYSGLVSGKKVIVERVYYKTPHAMWRFYGYYGGLNVTGDFHTYGQYADDSTFEVIPAWQNKLQAVAYEDHLYTRTSHYSYEIINNQLRLFPVPDNVSPENFWVRFSIATGSFGGPEDERSTGINNMNTLPFENIPYQSINSIGKQWIRRFALALSKETLGQIRSKFGDNIPIPGETLTLNGKDLLSQAQTEQKDLREELKSVLDEMTYAKLIETDAAIADNSSKIQEKITLPVFVG